MAFSEETKHRAFERAHGKCERCGKLLSYDNHSEGERGAWELHHIKPVRDGGSDLLSNARVLCLACHKNTVSYGRN